MRRGDQAEREILRQSGASAAAAVRSVITSEELIALQDSAARVTVDDSLVDYMLQLVERTRTHEALAMGVSPRGAQALL